jgi:hypothetical protein
MKVRQVRFQFKGARQYIQGPDLFNKMIDVGYPIERLSNIRFHAHHFVSSPLGQMYLTSNREDLNGLEDISARCQFDVDHATCWIALKQLAADEAGERCDFDEERVISLCRLQGETITLTEPSPFSFIETIVSMNKHLHQNLFPEAGGKWIFTRVDLDAGCEKREKLELRFKHNMQYRLTKSDIWVEGQKIGDLFFSLVKS